MKKLKNIILFFQNAWRYRSVLTRFDKPHNLNPTYLFLKQNLIDLKVNGHLNSALVPAIKNVDRCITLIENLERGDYYERSGGVFLTYDNMTDKEARMLYASKAKTLNKSLKDSVTLESEEKTEIISLLNKIQKNSLELQIKEVNELNLRLSKMK
jgi:hypothetical protein